MQNCKKNQTLTKLSIAESYGFMEWKKKKPHVFSFSCKLGNPKASSLTALSPSRFFYHLQPP
jgi:hypothetical protein